MLDVSPKAAIVMRHTVTRVEDPPEQELAPSLAMEAFATPGFAEVAEGLEEGAGEERTPQAGKTVSPEFEVLGFLLALRNQYLCFLSGSSS